MLALLGDSVTTDHISPAGSIKRDGPAGAYLQEQGVAPRDFNSYGSRRGNHEVMMRGTFANIRLRNQLAPGTEGGVTRYLADGAASRCRSTTPRCATPQEGVPLVVLAGKEYGSGSSRDWAAKGTRLLGVRAVIAQSFERIHRSNLVGMGVLPLQFPDGESAASLGLSGEEAFSIDGLADGDGRRRRSRRGEVRVRAAREGAEPIEFDARVRIDTPREAEYFRHGGILQYVLRDAAGGAMSPAATYRSRRTQRATALPQGAARPARRARALRLRERSRGRLARGRRQRSRGQHRRGRHPARRSWRRRTASERCRARGCS